MASRMLSTALRPAASAVSRQTVTAQRGFSASAMSMKQKEGHDESYDPEKHKQDLLSKQKSGKGHWKPELASESEAAVKADRTNGEDIATLQNRTKATAEETSKGGTSMHDGL
ncbi:hypothetical protein F5B22DRAFT_69078 [Xylaria bambusicola]|uniref:uncharacterized protein n=1 Tax=Xylaria bambusicola TaxID=326684 RepID=UPI0020084E4D|nr:uncharacterized protein F5B22DRAFT_69078 [Xylaria bambusicola]KAI0518524.1 hypothetical protein F5B22DRAFT_69078 [Xylaria bambusicola]